MNERYERRCRRHAVNNVRARLWLLRLLLDDVCRVGVEEADCGQIVHGEQLRDVLATAICARRRRRRGRFARRKR